MDKKKTAIQQILQTDELPGSDAHKLMMPNGRRLVPESTENPVDSSVLLLLYREQKDIKLAFIERVDDNSVHSGQIAFPGGRFEESDDDFCTTALRETSEEIGVSKDVQILGRLSSLFIPPSGFVVHPFVGWVDYIPEFSHNSSEVKTVIPIDLFFLGSPEARTVKAFKVRDQVIEAPCFLAGSHCIWGATAMILSEFLVLLQRSGYFQNQQA